MIHILKNKSQKQLTTRLKLKIKIATNKKHLNVHIDITGCFYLEIP